MANEPKIILQGGHAKLFRIVEAADTNRGGRKLVVEHSSAKDAMQNPIWIKAHSFAEAGSVEEAVLNELVARLSLR